MNILKTTLIGLIATAAIPSAFAQWQLIDNFQQFSDAQIFLEPTDIGWHGSCPDDTDEYWFITDPQDADNMTMFVESGNQGAGYRDIWIQKALPGGGIAPGETGTLFLRSYWSGFDNNWHVGTADKQLAYDEVTGLQVTPGAWGDFNALIRLGMAQNIEHRDGGGYVATNPPVVLNADNWYSFWLVVENTWDMSTSPPSSTGVYTLYMQGPGIGDGVSPTLIPVGTDPPKDKADFRRAPTDEDGNPQAIIWAQFSTNSGAPGNPSTGNPFLLDDFYFSLGENLTNPLSPQDPLGPATVTDLEAAILSDSQVQLTWQDNASNEVGFKILMKASLSGDWVEVADVEEANASGCLVEGIEVNHSRFIVQVYDAEGRFRTSTVAIASWGNPVLQGAYMYQANWWNLHWFGDYIELNRDWISHKELGTSYLVGENHDSFHLYSNETGCWFWTSADVYPFLYKYGAYAGWYYFYRDTASADPWFARLADETFVRASYINEAVPPPAAPSNLVAYIYDNAQVRLLWDDNANDETGYRIYMQVGEGPWTELANVPTKNLKNYVINDVDLSNPLRFRVQAYKPGNESELSNIALAEDSGTGFGAWILMDDFQHFEVGQVFLEPTDIGWHGSSPEGTDEYWFLADPQDADNITLYVESGNYGVGYGDVWIQKAFPLGGIAPGETGTLFLRSYWEGFTTNWKIGTADRNLQFDPDTGKQTVPGSWGDFNALLGLGDYKNIKHRDGGSYVATNPPQVIAVNQWYSFWLVVENTWDMSTSPPSSTGVYTLYMQGSGIGDGVSPTLIPVGTDPPKDKAFIRRPPTDDAGNPQAIIWAQFSTNSGPPGSPSAGDPFLLDDFYFSLGENLTNPLDQSVPALKLK